MTLTNSGRDSRSRPLDPNCPPEAGAYAREKADQRMAYLDRCLFGRQYLLERFSVADAYLATVLNWSRFVGPDVAKWAAIKAYMEGIYQRPSVAKALAEETALYQERRAARP